MSMPPVYSCLTLLVSEINVFRQLTAPQQPLTFSAGRMLEGKTAAEGGSRQPR